MEVGQGPNWGCSAKERKILMENDSMQINVRNEGNESNEDRVLVNVHTLK
jgi:hypothetical protein